MGRAGFRRWTIDYDLPCGKCGYSLRSLRPGERCPECGQEVPPIDPAEDRHLLHRADPVYLGRLVRGATGLIVVTGVGCCAVVAAAVGFLTENALGVVFVTLCIAWGGLWQAAAANDGSETRSSPYNTGARHTRVFAAASCGLTAGFAVAGRSVGDWLNVIPWGRGLDASLLILTMLGIGCLGFAHLATAMSYHDAVVYRARRVAPERALRWRRWLALLAVVTFPLSLATVVLLALWQMRRAGVAAIRANVGA